MTHLLQQEGERAGLFPCVSVALTRTAIMVKRKGESNVEYRGIKSRAHQLQMTNSIGHRGKDLSQKGSRKLMTPTRTELTPRSHKTRIIQRETHNF